MIKKIHYNWEDFEKTIDGFGFYVHAYSDIVLFSIYQGSLTLGSRLSKQYNLPHSILKFQHMDGDDKEVSVLYDALGDPNKYEKKQIFLIDDIYDTGKTIDICTEFLKKNYPLANINIFCIFANTETLKKNGYKHNIKYEHKHDGTWIQFIPWEGK